jgi:hypothetical protein
MVEDERKAGVAPSGLDRCRQLTHPDQEVVHEPGVTHRGHTALDVFARGPLVVRLALVELLVAPLPAP